MVTLFVHAEYQIEEDLPVLLASNISNEDQKLYLNIKTKQIFQLKWPILPTLQNKAQMLFAQPVA